MESMIDYRGSYAATDVQVIVDDETGTASILVRSVEVARLFPLPDESPTDFLHRVDTSRVLAESVHHRMSLLVTDRAKQDTNEKWFALYPERTPDIAGRDGALLEVLHDKAMEDLERGGNAYPSLIGSYLSVRDRVTNHGPFSTPR